MTSSSWEEQRRGRKESWIFGGFVSFSLINPNPIPIIFAELGKRQHQEKDEQETSIYTMPRPRRSSRRNYNRIVGIGSNDGGQDDTDDDDADPGLVGVLPVITTPLDAIINATALTEQEDNGGGTSSSSSSSRPLGVNVISNDVVNTPHPPPTSPPSTLAAAAAAITNEINIVVMDAAQRKFNIASDASWTILQFKRANSHVTRVPPQGQRLIHMGKLLNDASTLADCGIRTSGQIVHLFPKPNVVINDTTTTTTTTTHGGGVGITTTTTGARSSGGEQGGGDNGDDDEDRGGSNGAHIPQIIIDADEASRRSQILILSSQEIFEAQHRVKIFSFLLMIISSMELLTLMTLFVGMNVDESQERGPYSSGGGSGNMNHEIPPGNPTDIPPTLPNSTDDMNNMIRTWQDSDYFDTLISAFGLYVSLLGIKATTENTIQLARQYLLCLTLAGLGSNCYYYYLNVNAQQKQAEARGDGDIDISVVHTTAFVGILLPMTIWILCIVRAYQFHMLIRDAEVEAQQRTASNSYGNGSSGVVEPTIDNRNVAEGGEGDVGYDTSLRRTLSYGSDDLELAVERGVST